MKPFLESLDTQIVEAIRIGTKLQIPKNWSGIKKILFCGMGGSAIGGDILRRIEFKKDRFPFLVQRTPAIPKWVDSETLAIVSSYSGNTREVLEAFQAVHRAKAKMLVVSSGGKLAALAKKHKLPHVIIPNGMPPRCAVGYMTFVLIPALNKMKLMSVSKKEIAECLKVIQQLPKAKAKSLAKKMAHHFAHLYAVSGIMEPVLTRWRAQLAENSKTLVSHQYLPEMYHNEIEGWNVPRSVISRSVAVFFIDREDPAWIAEKRKVTQRIIRKHHGKVIEVASTGKSSLARIFSLIALGDWVSYELAMMYKVDPLSIKNIDYLKKVR